jgi:hypothetical protein
VRGPKRRKETNYGKGAEQKGEVRDGRVCQGMHGDESRLAFEIRHRFIPDACSLPELANRAGDVTETLEAGSHLLALLCHSRLPAGVSSRLTAVPTDRSRGRPKSTWTSRPLTSIE